MLATCASLLAVLAQAGPADTVRLTGTCGAVDIKTRFSRPVTVDASRATVRGLRLSGSNIRWNGGTLAATSGMRGKGLDGYALHISGSNIVISGVTFTDARLGVLIHKAAQVRIENSRFAGLRSDGVNLVSSTGIAIVGNRFDPPRPNPPVCHTLEGAALPNVKSVDCNGRWEDGDHPDAVQMRDGVIDVLIENNIVTGNTQGLTQMDTKGDAPLSNVRIVGNEIATDNYHHITLGACNACRIERNIVKRARGSSRKAIIRPGTAVRCGNRAEDEKTRDRGCT